MFEVRTSRNSGIDGCKWRDDTLPLAWQTGTSYSTALRVASEPAWDYLHPWRTNSTIQTTCSPLWTVAERTILGQFWKQNLTLQGIHEYIWEFGKRAQNRPVSWRGGGGTASVTRFLSGDANHFPKPNLTPNRRIARCPFKFRSS